VKFCCLAAEINERESLLVTFVVSFDRRRLELLMRSALRLALITMGSCAYAGLAILGWGGFRPFFSHSALIALVVVLFALSGVAFFAGGNLSRGVREARSNRWVLAVFAVIGFTNAYLPAYTDRKELWTIDGDTIRWLGVALFAAGGALRLWPVFVLGQRFSGLAAIQPGHTRHQRCLRTHPSPELSWPAHQLTRMELGFSFGSWRHSHVITYSASPCSHQC
jgi:hypothetical protein